MLLAISTLLGLFVSVQSIPQAGVWDTGTLHSWTDPWEINAAMIDISCHPLGPNPKVAFAINEYSGYRSSDMLAHAYGGNMDPNGASFTIRLDAWFGETITAAEVAWFGVGGTDANQYQIGTFEVRLGEWGVVPANEDARISFPTPFSGIPEVAVFISGISQSGRDPNRFTTYADGIDEYGFTLHMDTWADTQMWGAGATWIAFDPNVTPSVACGRAASWDYRYWDPPVALNQGRVIFGQAFHSTPQVFIALQAFDLGDSADIRLKAYATDITEDGFTWHCDDWGGADWPSEVYACGVSWIAFA